MTDEENKKKKVFSLPPPPTDELDDEWGGAEGAKPAQAEAVPSPATAAASAAPGGANTSSTEASADEDEDEDEDEADEGHDEDEADDDHTASHRPPPPASTKSDWLPEWAPFAVLALLVSVSIVFGLGLNEPAPPADPAADAKVEGAAKPATPAGSANRRKPTPGMLPVNPHP